jgi:hypothetical protein
MDLKMKNICRLNYTHRVTQDRTRTARCCLHKGAEQAGLVS